MECFSTCRSTYGATTTDGSKRLGPGGTFKPPLPACLRACPHAHSEGATSISLLETFHL